MKKRLNYVDILLIAVIFVVIIFLATLVFRDSSKVDFSATETIDLTLRVKNIPIKNSDLIKSNDSVYMTDSEEFFGVVKYVSYDNENVEFLDKLTNTSSTYKSPDKMTALILIEANAHDVDGEYYINGQKITRGESLELFVPSYEFEAVIVKIENLKE